MTEASSLFQRFPASVQAQVSDRRVTSPLLAFLSDKGGLSREDFLKKVLAVHRRSQAICRKVHLLLGPKFNKTFMRSGGIYNYGMTIELYSRFPLLHLFYCDPGGWTICASPATDRSCHVHQLASLAPLMPMFITGLGCRISPVR